MTGRRNGFHATGTRAATDSIEQVLLGAELAHHHGAINQRVVHRQHADGRRVLAVRLFEFHELRGIGMAIVKLERHGHRATMRWNGDEHALFRVVAGQHVAEPAARGDPDAELRHAAPLGLDARQHLREPRLRSGRGHPDQVQQPTL